MDRLDVGREKKPSAFDRKQLSIFAVSKQLIPELSTIPHADTLARLLERIDTDGLESCYENTIIEFIKSKTFLELNPGKCLIALDGTQKFSRKYCFDERALVRSRGDEAKERFYVYALESVIILENGIVLPLFTEILENDDAEFDVNGAKKQDCHCYSYNWNAMKAYHSLMKFAHFINALITSSVFTYEYIKSQGIRWWWNFKNRKRQQQHKSN